MSCSFLRKQSFTTDKELRIISVCVDQNSGKRRTRLLNVKKSHFPVQRVKCVSGIHEKNCLSAGILRNRLHGMNSSFTASLLSATDLQSTSHLFNFTTNGGEDSFSQDATHHLTNSYGSNSWTFIESNKSTGNKGSQTVRIHIGGTYLFTKVSQRITQLI